MRHLLAGMMIFTLCLSGCKDKDNPASNQVVPDELIGAWDREGVPGGGDYIFFFSDKRFQWYITNFENTQMTITGTILVNEANSALEFDGEFIQTVSPLEGEPRISSGPFNSVVVYQILGDVLQIAQGGDVLTYNRRTIG